MAFEVFTAPWAAAWREEINRSEEYRRAAETWEWPLVLVMEADPDENIDEDRGVYVDLFHGECRDARPSTPQDLNQAPYVITADPFSWREVLEGKIEAIQGIMRGKLVLSRGNMVTLAGYILAAQELVKAATRIDTVFPAENR
ncbi:MAG: Fis family transcriptional regulator [Firmicutes bacterium]|nr:Fis family transcriptional regulator [Bacillota bacterium]